MRRDGCGSYRYFAPELVRGEGFGPKIDVWAIGCITYMLCAQKYPFYDKQSARDERAKRNNTKRHIIYGQPNFGDETKNASPEAIEFIKSCLIKDQNERPTIAQLLESEWMQALKNKKDLLKRRQIEIGANILQFAKASTAQAWVCSMIANLMTTSEELREVR